MCIVNLYCCLTWESGPGIRMKLCLVGNSTASLDHHAFEQNPYCIRKSHVTLIRFSWLQGFISDKTACGKVPSLSYSYSGWEKLLIAQFFMIFLIFFRVCQIFDSTIFCTLIWGKLACENQLKWCLLWCSHDKRAIYCIATGRSMVKYFCWLCLSTTVHKKRLHSTKFELQTWYKLTTIQWHTIPFHYLVQTDI